VLMERMSIKTYAARNKLSMFNVVKMIKAGKLKSETVEEAGKEPWGEGRVVRGC